MKAMVYQRYGAPDVLALRDVDVPVARDDEVLVRVRASSVNPYDWHFVTGRPYLVRTTSGLLRPKAMIPGADLAGEVVAVGGKVSRFRPGGTVFGLGARAYAEYVTVRQDLLAPKPANLTFEQAAAVPLAGLTALQGLRARGRLAAGQQVLVNGASGGVGTFAVQIAKAFGAEVTGVCRSRHVELIRSLGADHVIDYTRADFVQSGQRYDLILDIAGNRSLADRQRALSQTGTLVVIGGPKHNRWVGPMGDLLTVLVAGRFSRQRLVGMLTKTSQADLDTLRDLIEAGAVTPVVECTYPLLELPQALQRVGEGHSSGKIVIAA